MLILDSYAAATLQAAQSLVVQALGDGMTLEQLRLHLDQALAGVRSSAVAAGRTVQVPTYGLCPSCGRSTLTLWPTSSAQTGLLVVGCRSCRYSEIRQ